MKQNLLINSEQVIDLIQQTLNQVDPRLVNHGVRVAFLVSKMLELENGFSEEEKRDICILCMVHDIGAYKTDELNDIVRFETGNILQHSVYGYLFLKNFSPLERWAEVILYHHTAQEALPVLEDKICKVVQLLKLADRIDVYGRYLGTDLSRDLLSKGVWGFLDGMQRGQFSEFAVDCFERAEKRFSLLKRLCEGDIHFSEVHSNMNLSNERTAQYLKMLVYVIDFRSPHMVTHTITTTHISICCARYLGIDEERIERIKYGAIVHDLGKVGIPIEILEHPGKLSPSAMEVMRTHVEITEKILKGRVAEDIIQIAIRHHEKSDGSGYMRGLKREEMTVEQQIVAVSDIVSALLGVRSYKNPYSKERTIAIIQEMARDDKINADIVQVICENFDNLLAEVEMQCSPLIERYESVQTEYQFLLEKYL